ncbi:MAG: sensor domain-containing diguanylate cyclase [Acidobacteriota bacterium]|nr:sensor domain-containing diguanylate cyclase [Acidobacteriota bacterium]
MLKPPRPAEEAARLLELHSLGILDSGAEERFDRITRLAQRLFGVPTALVTFVDDDRQWFKSRIGLDLTETPRDISFCGHAIANDEIMTVPDASADVRFFDNPLVQDKPNIRFYAGCPISGPNGSRLGTLCIIDQEPREMTDEEMSSLRDLAAMVESEIATSRLAVTDTLTGLGNLRGFELAASVILGINQRRRLDSTLLYLDLDQFKLINDRFGHSEGDRALREFADYLRSVFRLSDVTARLGGDEFAVLLSGASEHEGAAERLNHALDARNQRAEHSYSLRASVGSAVLTWQGDETLERLLRRADEAMFREKRRRQTT